MKRKLLGYIGVDAGLCWIGDPCYVLGNDASSRVNSWSEFCDKLRGMKESAMPLGEGVGVVVRTGYGDGEYPVYGYLHTDGTIAKVMVEFLPGD